MIIGLSIKNKIGFIDGTFNNHVVISCILNSVSKPISASLIFTDSAREIWLDLKDRGSLILTLPYTFVLIEHFLSLSFPVPLLAPFI